MILLLFFLSLTLTEARCPLNAIESTEYDSCYLHGPIKADWEGAEEICQLLGGHLPSIKDQAQNAYITKIMDEVRFESLWIGGQYNGTAWTWSDGTDFNFVHFLGAASYAAKGYATSILLDDPAPGYSGYWQSENMDFTAQPFICQIPRCNSKGHSAKSILKMPKVLTFSSLTNSWYYAYKQGFAKPKEAEANCAALGGHLPSVHSAFENSDLLNILIEQTNAQTDFSLGLFSDLNGANFKFSDGTVFGYSNWAPGEPKQLLYSEDSAFSSKTGLWSTLGDSQRAPDQEALLYACAFPENVNYCA